MRISALLVISCLLSACAESDGSADSRFIGDATVPPHPAVGESCAGIYGDPPRPAGPSPAGTAANLFPIEASCPARGGELMTWSDPDGTPREACLHAPANASTTTPLPLLVFLGGSLFPGDIQTPYNTVEFLNGTADLSGDPQRPGFILLMVEGRDKEHFYPFPDDHAWGFDHWYRNFNRNDPALNVDVATIDHFIAEVRARGIVDPRRVFMSGWSNGASMSILYMLNTPGIAAVAVYSSPEPFSDLLDPCPQPPFGNNLRPIMTVHNDCDIGGICLTGSEGFARRMARHMPQVEYRPVIIDKLQQEVPSCNASCSYSGDPMELANEGSPRHLTWPYLWNEAFFEFLRQRPLPN